MDSQFFSGHPVVCYCMLLQITDRINTGMLLLYIYSINSISCLENEKPAFVKIREGISMLAS